MAFTWISHPIRHYLWSHEDILAGSIEVPGEQIWSFPELTSMSSQFRWLYPWLMTQFHPHGIPHTSFSCFWMNYLFKLWVLYHHEDVLGDRNGRYSPVFKGFSAQYGMILFTTKMEAELLGEWLTDSMSEAGDVQDQPATFVMPKPKKATNEDFQ